LEKDYPAENESFDCFVGMGLRQKTPDRCDSSSSIHIFQVDWIK